MTQPPTTMQVDVLLARISRAGLTAEADLLRLALTAARKTAGGLQSRTQQQAATIRGLEQRLAELERPAAHNEPTPAEEARADRNHWTTKYDA